MDTTSAMDWVDRYIAAWRRSDAADLEDLFTPDIAYRTSPYDPPMIGHPALAEFWVGDAGRDFTAEASPIAVQDERAVIRVEVVYRTPQHSEYRDLWLLRFAADGRVADFEEWAYWPGRPHTAGSDD